VTIIASVLLATLFAAGPGPNAKLPSPLEATARQMLTNLNAGRFEAATKDFNDTLRTTISPTTLAEVKQEADAKVGAFVKVTEVLQKREKGFRVVELVCQYERSPVSLRVVFDAYDRIGAVFFNPLTVDPLLEATARELVGNFTGGHFDAATKHFDANLRVSLTPTALEALSKQVADRYGVFSAITEIHQRSAQGLRILDVGASYDREKALVSVVFNAAGQVAGLRITPDRR